jgi:predicted nucleic acid-binding protein
VIVDTNAISALADGAPGLAKVAADADVLSIPTIALGEFLYGIASSRKRARYETWLTRLLEDCPLLVVDETTSHQYAAIRQELRRRGRPIPSNDTWIAALALQHAMPVLSRDTHFDEVSGLRRIGW